MTNTQAINAQARTKTAYLSKEGYSLDNAGAAVHIYRDEDNFLLARLRLTNESGQKKILPMRQNASGGFELKEPPAPTAGKPIYNLDQLAKRPGDTVYFVEGEACADALMGIGMLATTSGAATSDEKADYTPLAGRTVICWPDNDQTGRDHMQRVGVKLGALGCEVATIDIDALGLEAKGDCADWLEQFATDNGRTAIAGDVAALMQGTPESQPDDLSCVNEDEPEKLTRAALDALAVLAPIEYEKVRVERAKAFKVRQSFLDSEVRKIQNAGKKDRLPFPEVFPHDDPVSPSDLLDDVKATIKRFIVLDDEQATAAALWTAITWFVNELKVMPLCIINAPEKACGKTQLLTVIGRMCYRPIPAANASPSALFRAVEAWKPTILIDEADTFFKDNDELAGLVNCGYSPDGYVLRSEAVGDSFEPKAFSVYSPKAIAGISLEKHLKDATMSRGVIIGLRRKLAGETVERLRYAEAGLFEDMSSRLARFAEDYAEQVRDSRPHMPDALSDREQDNFYPLLAVASTAGGRWLDAATTAALRLCNNIEPIVSLGTELLADIQTVFEQKRVNRISTADLLSALNEDDEAAWLTYNRGKPLAPRQLSRMLKQYGIESVQYRPSPYSNPVRGFTESQFSETFTRYLSTPEILPLHVTKPTEAIQGGACAVTDNEKCNVTHKQPVTAKPIQDGACNTVTDKTAILGASKGSPVKTDYARF